MTVTVPTYRDVLAAAQSWRATHAAADLRRAEAILRDGMAEYPFALPLGDELALVLERQGRDAEAEAVLHDLGSRFQDAGEETLCRLGKVNKKLADQQARKGNLAAAFSNLIESEHRYGQAFEAAQGFYPRINQLTVRFVRAGVAAALARPAEAADLVREVRAGVRAMLTDPAVWRVRKPDDPVWMPATQGEANVLLADWPAAEAAYAEAMRQAAGRKFYHDCMCGQVRDLLLPACGRLGVPVEGPLADPDAFFRLPPEAVS